jgi:2-phosphoglycerate kinase
LAAIARKIRNTAQIFYTEISHTYTAYDLNKLMEQAQHQRVMLISDTSGMRKSTVLTHLSKQISQKYPTFFKVTLFSTD